jgi:serine/threonine protein kinase
MKNQKATIICSDGTIFFAELSSEEWTSAEFYQSDSFFIKVFFEDDLLERGEDSLEKRRIHYEHLIERLSSIRQDPYWSSLINCPFYTVQTVNGKEAIGVVMKYVRDQRPLKNISSFFSSNKYKQPTKDNEQIEYGWWIGRVALALKLVRIISYFERIGLNHNDISKRNILVDSYRGKLTLIDMDSVSTESMKWFELLLTEDFAAPELYSDTEDCANTIQSDRHSLAVLIYMLLLPKHPLRAKYESYEDSDTSKEMRFIEFPPNRPGGIDDDNNDNQFISMITLGQQMTALFNRAFVDGLHHPHLRPAANDWERSLIDLYARIIPCANPRCLMRSFAASDCPDETLSEYNQQQCPYCGTVANGPTFLPFIRCYQSTETSPFITIVGWPDRPIYEWYIDPTIVPYPTPDHRYQPEPILCIIYDTIRQMWYLWNVDYPDLYDDRLCHIPPGDAILLNHGLRLWFGKDCYGDVVWGSGGTGEPCLTLPMEIIGQDIPWPQFQLDPTELQDAMHEPTMLDIVRPPQPIELLFPALTSPVKQTKTRSFIIAFLIMLTLVLIIPIPGIKVLVLIFFLPLLLSAFIYQNRLKNREQHSRHIMSDLNESGLATYHPKSPLSYMSEEHENLEV